jgi:WD40 repeat protein
VWDIHIGKQLASGSENEFVRVWDVPTGWQLALIKGHMGSVQFAALPIE